MAAGGDEIEEILRTFRGGFGPGHAELVEAEPAGLCYQPGLQIGKIG
jgi:hypothetical protein